MWRFITLAFVAFIATSHARDSSEDGIAPGIKKTNCTCGWANRSGKRIIGGQETEVNEFPMMAGLIMRRLYIPGIVDKENIHFCGGTIITHRHVVTAGHCMHDQNGNRLKPKDIGVVLGAHDLRKLDYKNPNVMRAPEKLILHPRYRWQAHYDLAIVVLPYVKFSQIIGPACLPTQRFDVAAKVLKVIGWGFITPQGPGSDILKKTDIIGMSHKQCSLIWGIMPPFEINDPYQVCTYQPGTSQCLGDSGGPILWRDPFTNRYTLVAAPSYGTSTCHTHPCVSSDISYYVPWIQQIISETYPEEKTCAKVD
uniref:Venom S1 protease 16 n=1 Tax=Platymeris rhadamanthus TaxID=1134088 RepID=A0A6B9KZB0_PLARH|nr:venom S1 protease 16 [Platymeris rhadamanthus]